MRITLALVSLAAAAAYGQTFEFWPGTQYDAAVPPLDKVLGYKVGERVAPPGDIVRYFEALAAAAPTRMKLFDYAKSWENRRLVYAAIGSESNIRRLGEIKTAQLRLADPRRTAAAEAQKIMAALPAVIALSYGVHGNEISSPDAAMMTAYHLLAAKNDKMIQDILASVVILIDPVQNPDGRNRFVFNYEVNEGLEPDPNPASAERAEPWPGGRANHYLFDMNRDWFAMTQPETRGRIKYLNEWLPLVYVDLHEMGTDSSYFFTPGSQPYNPHITEEQVSQMKLFGQNNAKWFDQFGFTYFTREVFDEFYPGYGASWPWFYGAMGMTYENASVRGLVARRSDDSLYTFRESVRKHFVASIATCQTAQVNREKLLANFYKYQQTAIEEGQRDPVKEYILPYKGDTSAVDKLARLLATHGIEVKRAADPFRNAGKEYPAGTYVIPLAQPRKRFVRTLMDPDTPLKAEFIQEQERRRKKRLPDEIYDVTAWSLPMIYNVETVSAPEVSAGRFEPVPGGAARAPGTVSGKAEVAYLVPWGTQAAARFLTAALRANLKILSANKPFKQGGRDFPSGSLILMVKQNSPALHETVTGLAATSGASIVATNTSWVDDGIDFGSNNVTVLRKPAIAMLWDSPVSSISAGQTRFVLERQYGYPVTVIRAQILGGADLSRFQVLILPDSGFGPGYNAMVSPAAQERIKAWVRSGGVVIGIGSALNFLSSPSVGLLALQQESLARETQGRPAEGSKPQGAGSGSGGAAAGPPAAGSPAAASPSGPPPGKIFTKPEDFDKAILPDNQLPDAVQGVLARARIDPELWITAGLPSTLHVLVNGRNIFAPIKRDRGVNAVVFEGPEKLLAAGYIWEENRKQLAYKPVVVVQNEGRGAVVGFTVDPNFRAYMDGLNVLFLNSVFRYPNLGRGAGAEELREERE